MEEGDAVRGLSWRHDRVFLAVTLALALAPELTVTLALTRGRPRLRPIRQN